MRLHCSSMPKIMAFKTLDGASFWVKNAKKKKHFLAYTRLDKNALRWYCSSILKIIYCFLFSTLSSLSLSTLTLAFSLSLSLSLSVTLYSLPLSFKTCHWSCLGNFAWSSLWGMWVVASRAWRLVWRGGFHFGWVQMGF